MVNESNKKVEMKAPGKFRKERVQAPPTKIVIRKLPPTFTEEEFKNAISPVPDNNYFSFVPADKRLGIQAYSRAYINFINSEEIVSFRDRFDGYVFVDQKGNEYPALVEYAPFQKIPKTNHNKKDIRCGTIDEDPDYVAFLELLQNPEAVNLPPIETLLEEIENAEREIRANNGVIKVKTPLLEYIEQRNAERYRPGDRKRRKEFDRKKARDEEKRRKKEYIKEYRKRDDYYAAREERERERAKRREEEKLKWKEKREEREKLRREKAAERYKNDKNDEKLDSKDLVDDGAEERKSSQVGGKEHSQKEDKSKVFPSQKSKRYSEVRKKEERDRKKDNVKNKGNEEKKENIPLVKDEQKIEQDSPLQNTTEDVEKEKLIEETYETKVCTKEEVVEQKESSDTKDYGQEGEENTYEEGEKIEEHGKDKCEEEIDDVEKDDNKEDKMSRDKDPRTERRIRNKDRPAMQLYRPGQARLKTRLKSNEEGGTNNDEDSSSSSTSPVMGVNEEEKDKEDKKNLEPSESTTTKPTGKSYNAVRSSGYDRKYPKYRDSRGGGQHHHHHHHWDDRENYSYSRHNKDDYEGSTRGSGRGRKGYSYHQERENKSKWANKAKDNDSSQFKSMTFRRSTSQE